MTRRLWILAAALLALIPGTACRTAVLQAGMDQPITMRPGQWVGFGSRPLEISFLRVLQDSRCPLNTVCVRAGDAVIQLQGKSADGGFDTFEARLPGGAAPTDTTIPWDVWAGYRFRLLKLEPYPRAGVQVDSATYVATLLVRES